MARRHQKKAQSRVRDTPGRLRSSAEGTLATPGQIVHKGWTPASYDRKSCLSTEELALLERRRPRLERRLARIAAGFRSTRHPSSQVETQSQVERNNTSVSAARGAENTAARQAPPIPPVSRPLAGDGKPAPMCKHCGGLAKLESRVTYCDPVEKRQERWRCITERCEGFKDPAVYTYPVSEYERRC